MRSKYHSSAFAIDKNTDGPKFYSFLVSFDPPPPPPACQFYDVLLQHFR